MNETSIYTRAMNCEKPAYGKKQALSIINRRTKGRSRVRHNKPEYLRAYQCPECNQWHLTHKRNWG